VGRRHEITAALSILLLREAGRRAL